MQLDDLKATPSWEWPTDAGSRLLAALVDENAAETDRRLAAALAGDLVVMNDQLAAALIGIVENGREADELRAQAAISLGPVLEQVDTESLDAAEDLPIAEATFHRLQESLRRTYMDGRTAKDVRRRALEAAVRAPQTWHPQAIEAAYASDDDAWRLTAVFCMRFVKGFDEQILQALNSTDPTIQYEAVVAAGNWEIDAAWPHIAGLLASQSTEKSLLLAAIEAAPTIRPDGAAEMLSDLLESDDQAVVDAAEEALAMARGLSGDDAWEQDEDD